MMPFRFRFILRDLLWLTAVCAVLLSSRFSGDRYDRWWRRITPELRRTIYHRTKYHPDALPLDADHLQDDGPRSKGGA